MREVTMETFLNWLGDSFLASLIRGFLYPYVRAIHVGGAGVLFGSLALFDLRILGRKGHMTVSVTRELTMGLVWAGFMMSVIGGLLLFSAQPQALWENHAMRVKLLLILTAGLNALIFEYQFRKVNTLTSLRLSAGLSLILWTAILINSALIPYSVLR
ncbi:hypothetical protein LXD80_05190 [Enterobacter sp. ASE]|uniref:hypothetical protein n=1 Tax=Enterobacter sp. ASE TaxID=2905968 RepID=UPI001E4A060E|nr:hypothetical protein [Enterobacter sp. ASE]MCE3115197.1 hypothetical protein [Enterobacter sp. ASE]